MPESKISYRSEPFCTAFRAVFAGYDKHQIVHEQATQRARQPGNTVEWRRCNEINIIMPGGSFCWLCTVTIARDTNVLTKQQPTRLKNPRQIPPKRCCTHTKGVRSHKTHTKGGKVAKRYQRVAESIDHATVVVQNNITMVHSCI